MTSVEKRIIKRAAGEKNSFREIYTPVKVILPIPVGEGHHDIEGSKSKH